MKRSKYLISLILCLAFLAVSVSALETGSLTILNLEHPVTLFHVANGAGELTEAFADAPVEDLIEQRNAVKNAAILAQFAAEQGLSGAEMTPDESGTVLYPTLERGLYLVVSLAEGEEEFTAFLAAIPTRINGEDNFHVEAKPKEDIPDDTQPETTLPNSTQPTTPDDPSDIPQTGFSVWPKYSLLAAGILLILSGVTVMVTGKEKSHE